MNEDKYVEATEAALSLVNLLRERHHKLVNWVECRVAYGVRTGKLPPPDKEEIRLVAQMDQLKAQCLQELDIVSKDPSLTSQQKEAVEAARKCISGVLTGLDLSVGVGDLTKDKR